MSDASDGRADDGGRTVGDSTTMLLIGLGRLAQRRFEDMLAEENMSLRHVGAIGHLSRSSDLSVSDLARRAHVTPQSMHATIAQLVESGAVASETRGRASYLTLTPRGHDLLAFAAQAAATCDETLGFDAAAVPGLREELKKAAAQAINNYWSAEGR